MEIPQVLNEDESSHQHLLDACWCNPKVIRHHESTNKSVTTRFVIQAYGAGLKLILATSDQSVSADQGCVSRIKEVCKE